MNIRRILLVCAALLAASLFGQNNPDANPPMLNLSTRTTISADNPEAIVGIAIPENPDPERPWYPKNVLLRVIGPGLSEFGVANPLDDPQVVHFTQDGEEQAWTYNVTKPINPEETLDTAEARAAVGSSVAAAAAYLGAFAVAVPTLEAPEVGDFSLVVPLPPGNHTFVVSSESGASGDILIELYSLHN